MTKFGTNFVGGVKPDHEPVTLGGEKTLAGFVSAEAVFNQPLGNTAFLQSISLNLTGGVGSSIFNVAEDNKSFKFGGELLFSGVAELTKQFNLPNGAQITFTPLAEFVSATPFNNSTASPATSIAPGLSLKYYQEKKDNGLFWDLSAFEAKVSYELALPKKDIADVPRNNTIVYSVKGNPKIGQLGITTSLSYIQSPQGENVKTSPTQTRDHLINDKFKYKFGVNVPVKISDQLTQIIMKVAGETSGARNHPGIQDKSKFSVTGSWFLDPKVFFRGDGRVTSRDVQANEEGFTDAIPGLTITAGYNQETKESLGDSYWIDSTGSKQLYVDSMNAGANVLADPKSEKKVTWTASVGVEKDFGIFTLGVETGLEWTPQSAELKPSVAGSITVNPRDLNLGEEIKRNRKEDSMILDNQLTEFIDRAFEDNQISENKEEFKQSIKTYIRAHYLSWDEFETQFKEKVRTDSENDFTMLHFIQAIQICNEKKITLEEFFKGAQNVDWSKFVNDAVEKAKTEQK